MKKQLLLFDLDIFNYFKELKASEGYEIISITHFIYREDNIELSAISSLHNKATQIIDISALGSGFNAIQTVGEQLLSYLPDDGIYIADNKYEHVFRQELRYIFGEFKTVTDASTITDENSLISKIIPQKYKKIIDYSEDELKSFLIRFNDKLYGHDKFKDDFRDLILSFRTFNKLGEHKILSLFLMGESGVGKTEVARAIYECMGGEKRLAKVNFGNYSSEFSLSSLIGSARGYIGSDDGEIFKRVRDTDIGIILIDEFEKSNAALFNYFLDVLESGKITSSLADEMDLNGFIIVFTSNIRKENFKTHISPELRSRFDYKGLFSLLYKDDKERFVSFRTKNIIKKYNNVIEEKLNDSDTLEYLNSTINVENFTNMRDLNKKIKRTFVDYIFNHIEVSDAVKKNGIYSRIKQLSKDVFG